MYGVRQNVRDVAAVRSRSVGFSGARKCSRRFLSPLMQREDPIEIRKKLVYAILEFLMAVDDEDIPISYLFYIIAVIVVMGFLLVGGLFLWLR